MYYKFISIRDCCSLIYSIKQNDEVSLSSYALNGMYPNNENFTGTNKQVTKIAEDRRMPAYKAAMLGVCQLQLKICSKLIELASPSCPTLFSLTTFKPSTLKELAGQSILLHPCGLVGIFCRNSEINGDISIIDNDNDGLRYRQMLPNELVKFLQNGAADYD
ncbi:Uncharacterized protein BM_BM9544 [Brugia malayi]|uniref:Bm9544 n=1 Tax=Brugia malayi TaxID=6279 RepID=A0A0K0JZN5_BRUMA|nr:Uncharacterized protein BM_BM9544 [Brugia malayi]CDP94305.1 Bm9544 [Brugia malayi]VIO88819.1 Uncharacterized protein BM_BM9544 [Brugia malayi]